MRVANKSPERMKHGAVLVSGGRLIGCGFNKNVLNPYYYQEEKTRRSIHAEESVLKLIRPGDRRRYTLYVVRVGRSDGCLMLSKPCVTCASLISEYSCIKRVVHS